MLLKCLGVTKKEWLMYKGRCKWSINLGECLECDCVITTEM